MSVSIAMLRIVERLFANQLQGCSALVPYGHGHRGLSSDSKSLEVFKGVPDACQDLSVLHARRGFLNSCAAAFRLENASTSDCVGSCEYAQCQAGEARGSLLPWPAHPLRVSQSDHNQPTRLQRVCRCNKAPAAKNCSKPLRLSCVIGLLDGSRPTGEFSDCRLRSAYGEVKAWARAVLLCGFVFVWQADLF